MQPSLLFTQKGFKRQGPVQIRAGCGIGLGNIIPLDSSGKDGDSKAQNRVLQLSANYFFGTK